MSKAQGRFSNGPPPQFVAAFRSAVSTLLPDLEVLLATTLSKAPSFLSLSRVSGEIDHFDELPTHPAL